MIWRICNKNINKMWGEIVEIDIIINIINLYINNVRVRRKPSTFSKKKTYGDTMTY